MASKSKPVQAKSDPVVEAIQRELKQQGYFPYDVDGIAGEKTTNAIAARDAAQQRNRELEIELLKAQGSKKTADADAAATATETARKQRYDDQASSGLGMATQSAANLAAPAAGTALGMALGRGVNAGMDKAQESRNAVLRGAADDRMAGRTTVEGAREGVRRAGAMPPSTATGRVVSRMLPQVGLGALSLGKGAQVLSESDPNGEFYPAMADRAAGLGYIGAGAGLAKQGMRYAAAPGVAPDAQALAIINSNQIRRNAPQGALAQALSGETPEAAPAQPKPAIAAPEASQKPTAAPAPGTKAYMAAQAKDLGLKGVSKLSKSELATKLAEAMAEHGNKRTVKRVPKLPGGSGAAGIAAGLAYGMTPDRADAATGEMTGNTGQALTNAGIAGGVGYGVSKLAQALGPVARTVMSGTGEGMAPSAIDAMTSYSPEDLQTANNWMAQNLPRQIMPGPARQIHDMAQVPPRGDQAEIAQAQRMQAEQMPMASASALEIPSGIPAPREDGSDPYAGAQGAVAPQGFPGNIQARLDRMIRLGAPPEAVANFLNQAVR
jgi:hypothetical protein